MIDAVGHWLFTPRAELSYFAEFGIISIGFWAGVHVERKWWKK